MNSPFNTSDRAGRWMPQTSGYSAYIPRPLPPDPALLINTHCLSLLSEADRALGQLNGLASIIRDSDLFVYLYVRKEALLSSQIEGTQCSLEDVLQETPENSASTDDIQEVSNYVSALNQGLSRLQTLPISSRLLREIHAVLVAGVRGAHKTPGDFRTTQNWIGRPDATIRTAEFVPPPPHEVGPAMGALENYIHSDDRLPPLIRAALIHAQFETIHPFLDGNGRLGRMLVTFTLCAWGVMEKPLLYLSYFFKANRTEYYARLMDVRTRGNWEDWIAFFLRGVAETARMANQTALDIHHLHISDEARIRQIRLSSTIQSVFHEFCRFPTATVPQLVKRIPKSNAVTIGRATQQLADAGIVHQQGSEKRNRRFVYSRYLEILTRDTQLQTG